MNWCKGGRVLRLLDHDGFCLRRVRGRDGHGSGARDGGRLTGVVVRGLVLFELPSISVASGADRTDEGLFPCVDAHVGHVAFPS